MTVRATQDTLGIEALALPALYPRDLITLIPLRLPLAFVSIGELTTKAIQQWLARRAISYGAEGPHRRLHGALVARAGRGLIFIDSTDELSERQFTAAHEIAHFILDHLEPRLRAIKAFGEAIRPVLDGERAPTPEESVSSILNRAPLGVQIHLMTRAPTGAICCWDIEEREQRADRLALEILAPAKTALRTLQNVARQNAETDIDVAARILSQSFGLPMGTARPYAKLLLSKGRSRPRLSEVLLGADR